MLKIETDTSAGFVEITLDGPIATADYEAVVAQIDDALKVHEKLNLVVSCGRSGRSSLRSGGRIWCST